MPKKPMPSHAKKEHSSKQPPTQKSGRDEQPHNLSGRQKRSQEEGSDNGSNYRQQIREKRLAEGNKKNGCFPKLFMLLLPFAAVGTYLFLRL